MIYKFKDRKYFAFHKDYVLDYFTYAQKFIIPANQPFPVDGIYEVDGYNHCTLEGFGHEFPIPLGYFLKKINENQEDKMREIVRCFQKIKLHNSFAVKIKAYINRCEKMLESCQEIETNERFIERAKKNELIDYIKDHMTLLKSDLSYMKYAIHYYENSLNAIKD